MLRFAALLLLMDSCGLSISLLFIYSYFVIYLSIFFMAASQSMRQLYHFLDSNELAQKDMGEIYHYLTAI